MSRPLISVVIPVFNRARLVARALDSVFNQDYRPIHLIVVDNNSTDDTVPTVEKWKRSHESDDFRISLLLEKAPGAAAARNKGLAEVDSEWVIFLDSDDEMLPRLISTAMKAADSRTDLIVWRGMVEDGNGRKVLKAFRHRNPLRRHVFNSLLFTIAYAVRTERIRHCGGWDSSLKCWDDLELGLRLLACPGKNGGLDAPEIKFIDSPLVLIHIQEKSITGSSFSQKAGEWEKALSAMEALALTLPSPVRKKILWMLTYRRVNLAALYARERNRKAASRLLESTLPGIPLWRRLLLKGIFHYTRLGGRGAYILIR